MCGEGTVIIGDCEGAQQVLAAVTGTHDPHRNRHPAHPAPPFRGGGLLTLCVQCWCRLIQTTVCGRAILGSMPGPVLVILGGLPATGKSRVASELNCEGVFSYVRIDSIEQALRAADEVGPNGVGAAGYIVGYAVVSDLLNGGNDVLVECVNPLEITRSAWREVARTRGAALLEVELHCSDPEVHRGRAESRTVDVPGLRLPDWQAIQTREYETWDTADLRIDTCRTSPCHAAALILAAASNARSPKSATRIPPA